MQSCSLALLLALVPLAVQAQTGPDGTWTLTLTPPDGMTIDPMTVEAATAQDSLQLSLISNHGTMALEEVSLQDEALRFIISADHARIVCNVYRQGDDAFHGACEGPMGEFPAALERRTTP